VPVFHGDERCRCLRVLVMDCGVGHITYSGKASSLGLIWIGRLCQRCIFFPTSSPSKFPHINFGQLGTIDLLSTRAVTLISAEPRCSATAHEMQSPQTASAPQGLQSALACERCKRYPEISFPGSPQEETS
jgi:hypothetical protein